MTTELPILEYHDLSEKLEKGSSFHAPYVLEQSKFYAQMQWLRQHDYNSLTLDQLCHDVLPPKSIVLTFDDGHISNYLLAYPILKEFDFSAVFFIITSLVGKPNYLTVEQILHMQDNGMQFGSHSVTHPYLLALDRQEMFEEIQQSKLQIEALLNRAAPYFSIPYGFYNQDLLAVGRSVGYQAVFTEDFGYYQPQQGSFKVLPRFTIKADCTQQQFMDIVANRKIALLPRYCKEKIIQSAKALLGFRQYIRFKSLLVK